MFKIIKSDLQPFKGAMTERQERILTAWVYDKKLRKVATKQLVDEAEITRSEFYRIRNEHPENTLHYLKYGSVLKLLKIYNDEVSK